MVWLLMMKTHCQPCNDAWLCKPWFIAVIMTPANMLPIWPMAVKMAVRFAISSGLLYFVPAAVAIIVTAWTYYQDPRMYIVPL
jgi:hypothetical protein